MDIQKNQDSTLLMANPTLHHTEPELFLKLYKLQQEVDKILSVKAWNL